MFCTEKLFSRVINEKNVPIEPFSYAYFSGASTPEVWFQYTQPMKELPRDG